MRVGGIVNGKQIALDLFEKTRAEWLKAARSARDEVLLCKGEVCADDIWRVCPPPAYADPRVMGAVFNGLKCVGYRKSERKECHNRPIGVFTK